jgi:dCMP deaminase
MAVADTIALRSRCVRRRAGCVLVSVDNQLIAAGYNGPPGGFRVEYERIGAKRLLDANETCDTFCERAKTGGSLSYDDCVSVHSEVNALVFADHKCLIGGTAYVTSCPCFGCAKNLSNSGLIRVVYRITEADRDREPQRTAEFFATCGIAQTQLL